MSASPSVDVLMAVHASDRVEWLRESLDSLAAQTRPADAYVVVQDGPVSEAISEALDIFGAGRTLERIELPTSRGLGAALATGMDACSGDLIARMDADDVADPERLALQLEAFEDEPRLDVVGSCAALIDEDGTPVGERRMPLDEDSIRRHVWSNPFVHSSVMFRREAIAAVGGYDPELRTRQDYDLWFRCVEAGFGLRNLPACLVSYRVARRGKHRDPRVVWRQALTGWKGCRRVRAPLRAWIGVGAPLVLAVLPESVGRWARRQLKFSS